MKIIIFDPFIVIDQRCQARIGEKVIWDCKDFLELLDEGLVLDETVFRPLHQDNENLVSLGGWLFDISSTINHNASNIEILDGWALINDKDNEFVLDRMFQFFFRQLVIEAVTIPLSRFSKSEPLIIELLRLSYWYYRCYITLGLKDIPPSKRKEIRDKLFGRLLRKIEAYKTSIHMAEEYPEEKEAFLKKVSENMKSAKAGKKPDEEFQKFSDELFKATRSVISELIFSGLLCESSHKLDFDKRFDFTLDGIPCQVKTVLPDEPSSEEISRRISNRIHELDNGKIISESEVRSEIISLLQEKHSLIDIAMRQGGRIVCINGTLTYAGYLLNRWSSDNLEIPSTADKASSVSINLLTKEQSISLIGSEEKFIPLIFGAAAIDINCRFSMMVFRIPVRLALDEKSMKLKTINP